MHEVKIDVIEAKLLQTQIEVLLNSTVVGAPQFGSNEDVFPLESGVKAFFQALTYFIFVLVDKGTVDVTVSNMQSMRDRLLDLTGVGLPCPCDRVRKEGSADAGPWKPYLSLELGLKLPC